MRSKLSFQPLAVLYLLILLESYNYSNLKIFPHNFQTLNQNLRKKFLQIISRTFHFFHHQHVMLLYRTIFFLTSLSVYATLNSISTKPIVWRELKIGRKLLNNKYRDPFSNEREIEKGGEEYLGCKKWMWRMKTKKNWK